jgi:hypothetical protein
MTDVFQEQMISELKKDLARGVISQSRFDELLSKLEEGN